MRISDWSSDVCSSDRPPRTSLVPGERPFTSLSIMTEQTHSRLRALSDADHFPALSPEYLHPQPAFGLGPTDPRSAAHRVGQECASTFRSRRSSYKYNNTTMLTLAYRH